MSHYHCKHLDFMFTREKHFTYIHTKSNFNYKLKGTSLEHIDKEKDIGVNIDNTLNSEDHTNEKIKKGNCVMVI